MHIQQKIVILKKFLKIELSMNAYEEMLDGNAISVTTVAFNIQLF